MSLVTPEKLRKLQRTLYAKAKQAPDRRFHFLYDKVWREDILAHAFALSRANGGAPGVDGETFARVEAYGVGRWLADLREEVRTGRYRPQAVRRVMIPKSGGVGERPLGIPTIRDRVVQTAVKLPHCGVPRCGVEATPDMGSAKALHTSRYRAFLTRLRQARVEAGLTQEEIAARLGRPQTWVSKCELGERRVDFVEIEDFAAACKKPLEFFRTRTPGRGRR